MSRKSPAKFTILAGKEKKKISLSKKKHLGSGANASVVAIAAPTISVADPPASLPD